jgi:lysophospholipase L1-like esterase
MSYTKNGVWFVNYTERLSLAKEIMQMNPRPTYKVLAEGDSWFHITGAKPFNLRNLLDGISFNEQYTALANMALSGDVVFRIAQRFKNQKFYDALQQPWNMIMLSAGGNDLIDALSELGHYKVADRTLSIIKSNPLGTQYKHFINEEDLTLLLETIFSSYSNMAEYIKTTVNKHTPIVLHTYDYPTPNDAPAITIIGTRGPWLYRALCKKTGKNVPEKYWKEISDYCFDRLSDTLSALNKLPNFTVVKTKGLLNRAELNQKGESKDWRNEIHPNSDGFKKLSKKINADIAKILIKQNESKNYQKIFLQELLTSHLSNPLTAQVWPHQDKVDLFYGDPRGKNGQVNPAWEIECIVYVKTPWKLVTSWDFKEITKGVRVHKKCADSLKRIFDSIWHAAGKNQNKINEWGMNLYAGGFEFRRMTASSRLSMHSWGCAIDFDSARNAYGDITPHFKHIPLVLEAFASEGWVWGGSWSKPDGMHWQAATI